MYREVNRFLGGAAIHRLMNSCRPPLQRHPPVDVERQLWMWLESGRWHVANKRTITGWRMVQDGRVQSEEEGVHDLVVRRRLSLSDFAWL